MKSKESLLFRKMNHYIEHHLHIFGYILTLLQYTPLCSTLDFRILYRLKLTYCVKCRAALLPMFCRIGFKISDRTTVVCQAQINYRASSNRNGQKNRKIGIRAPKK